MSERDNQIRITAEDLGYLPSETSGSEDDLEINVLEEEIPITVYEAEAEILDQIVVGQSRPLSPEEIRFETGNERGKWNFGIRYAPKHNLGKQGAAAFFSISRNEVVIIHPDISTVKHEASHAILANSSYEDQLRLVEMFEDAEELAQFYKLLTNIKTRSEDNPDAAAQIYRDNCSGSQDNRTMQHRTRVDTGRGYALFRNEVFWRNDTELDEVCLIALIDEFLAYGQSQFQDDISRIPQQAINNLSAEDKEWLQNKGLYQLSLSRLVGKRAREWFKKS